MQEPALTLQEVSEILNISNQTVTRLIKRGEFPKAFRIGDAPNAPWRIPREDVVKFIQRHTPIQD